MQVWFSVRLDDRPGSLARVASALAERSINITGIVGVAEDTDGALMLTTSDPDRTEACLRELGVIMQRHGTGADDAAAFRRARRGLADRGLDVEVPASEPR